MQYDVYVDMSRPLTVAERFDIFEALDAHVPHSGYVGLDKGPNDEMFFVVNADSDAEAVAQATRYAAMAIRESGVDVQYTVAMHTIDGGLRTWKF